VANALWLICFFLFGSGYAGLSSYQQNAAQKWQDIFNTKKKEVNHADTENTEEK